MEWLIDGRVRFGREQRSTFAKDGFVMLPRFLSQRGLAYLRARVDSIYAEKAPDVDGEWITNIHQLLPMDDNWMWALATHPVVLEMVEESLGTGAQLYASQLHRKSPATAHGGGGHAVPVHQDGDAHVRTIWITLDDVDRDNGALEVLPGGHGLGRLPLRMVGSLEELDLAQYFARNNVYQIDMSVSHSAASAAGSSISSATRRRAFYTYRMAAGGAAMHHPLTPHRSSPNTSTRDRRVIILRFMASGDHDPPAYALHWAGKGRFRKEAFPVSRNKLPPHPVRCFCPPRDDAE